MMLRTLVVATMVALLGATGGAFAQSTAADSQEIANQVVSQQTSQAAATATAGIVGGAVAGAVSGPGGAAPPVTGMLLNTRMQGESAGAGPARFGAWAQIGWTRVDGDDRGGEFDGKVINGLVGFDYRFNPRGVVGLALAYEDINIDTTFNNGTFKGDGFGVIPYFGYQIARDWTLDAMFGYTRLDYKTTSGAQNTTASFNADRFFGAANVTGNFYGGPQERLRISPRVGILQMQEEQDSFTDSAGVFVNKQTIDLGRLSAGGTLGYRFDRIEPYVRAMAEYDYSREKGVNLGNGVVSSDDRFGVNAGIGLNLLLSDRVTGNIDASSQANFRSNLDVYTISGRLRVTW